MKSQHLLGLFSSLFSSGMRAHLFLSCHVENTRSQMAKISSSLVLKSMAGRSEFHFILFNADIICVFILYNSFSVFFKASLSLDFFYCRFEMNTTHNMQCDCFNLAFILCTFLSL